MLVAGRCYSTKHLALAVGSADYDLTTTIRDWRNGAFSPRGGSRNRLLVSIEKHFGRPEGFLGGLVDIEFQQRDAAKGRTNRSLQWAVDWHLPQNFDERPEEERKEILAWLSANILDSTTEYGKYIGRRTTSSFGVVFPTLDPIYGPRKPKGTSVSSSHAVGNCGTYGTTPAPPHLASEMEALIKFKTGLLAPIDLKRSSRWLPSTAQTVALRFGYLFGALTAAPFSRDEGLGVSPSKLTLALLVFPSVLNWFLEWSERRRGFFTATDASLLYQFRLHLRSQTGWIRQTPKLAERLKPIAGLVEPKDIAVARRDWSLACDKAYSFASDRALELLRVRRQHRDPYAAILPVLNANRPLQEYKKIGDEIMRLMPDEKTDPEGAALAVRSYLMLRFAMHLGFRQGNLITLQLCRKGEKARSSQQLEMLRCGELRWSASVEKWEVFIPALAFKNSKSPFFSGRPLLIVLPDLQNLYEYIERYIDHHRPRLLNGSADPGTVFVKHVRGTNTGPAYSRHEFYYAWKAIIRRYGIYNPYTNRGAIRGLLPHGPHCVRDVLATHILKETGSYELAGFAIQDTVQVVMRHYARFQPHEKAARAAEIINKVWMEPSP